MILEVAKCLTAWLGHGTYGVNALLASTVPREAGDALPVIATITDEFTNARAAGSRLPVALPALSVDIYEATTVEGQVVRDQGEGTVVARVRYGTTKSDLTLAKREGSYVLRALGMSLRLLMKVENEAARTRNGVRFRPAANGRLELRPYYEELEDRVVTAVALIAVDCRDFQPLPT